MGHTLGAETERKRRQIKTSPVTIGEIPQSPIAIY